ncbi:multicopper oxidase family protein [Ideonella sp.]|uniref:multicopper oxidase family protein n=1 Tax=Ideonella sp. TaxID=1929293 RepID=UPI0035B2BEF6
MRTPFFDGLLRRAFVSPAAWLAPALLAAALPVAASPINELPVLKSSNGLLDVLVVARGEKITTLGTLKPMGWVYDICPRPTDGSDTCPAKPDGTNLYGGTRLQLRPGDTLKMRLVNKLPEVLDSEHASEPGHHFLRGNPTNLHTHGLIVSPRFPTKANPTYGDNIFVMTLNPDNLLPGDDDVVHGDVRLGFTEYEVKIPKSHPAGLYWLHGHIHGLTLNQLSSGMSGVITIGDPSDYLCKNAACSDFFKTLPVRHLLLKDTQVLKSNKIVTEQYPVFCKTKRGVDEEPREGQCAGLHGIPTGGGKWYFSVNGQGFPHIPVHQGNGEIWRITTGSATVTYDLGLRDDVTGQNMLVQVLSVDGVAVEPDANASAEEIRSMSGARITTVPCPADVPGKMIHKPVCATRIMMMPSSRVELWVAHRDAKGHLAAASPNASATLYTAGVQTGPAGDTWPEVDLARITFRGTPAANAPQTLAVTGDSQAEMRDPRRIGAELTTSNAMFKAEADCLPLAPGHKRRIFMGFTPGGSVAFGLGYEELDENDQPVPGTFLDIEPFNQDRPTVCVPLGPGNTPTTERWEIVNIAAENHNFHVHQVKFSLLSRDRVDGHVVEHRGGVLYDNVPIPRADGDCESVADWRAGKCVAHPMLVEIPFTVAGDFAYHCHIGEHSDEGMMARIRIRANK